jgi:hypothetical protein
MILAAALAAGALSFFVATYEQTDLSVAIERRSENLNYYKYKTIAVYLSYIYALRGIISVRMFCFL